MLQPVWRVSWNSRRKREIRSLRFPIYSQGQRINKCSLVRALSILIGCIAKYTHVKRLTILTSTHRLEYWQYLQVRELSKLKGKRLSIFTGYRTDSTRRLKGQCHQIFHLCFFFFKQLLLAPVDKPSNDFDFFRIFAKIFDFSGASPVSLTTAKQAILL